LPFAATIVFCPLVLFVVPLAVVVATPFATGFLLTVEAVPGLAFATAALLAGETVLVAVVDASSASTGPQGHSNRPSKAQPRNFDRIFNTLTPALTP
jgi:hypothetical protein